MNVKHLLYSYANVMQQLDNSSCGFFTIAYASNTTFGHPIKIYLQCVTNVITFA